MKKLLIAITVSASTILLSGCIVSSTTYTSPAYTGDYVSTVGLYGANPRWGHGFYSGFGYDTNLEGSEPYYDGVGAYSSGWYTGY